MSKKAAIQFNINTAKGGGEYTLIPPARYAGEIAGAKLVEVASSGEQRLWLQFRINGPAQSGRYVTTLCVLVDTAKSAYKTASIAEAAPDQWKQFVTSGDPEALIGSFVAADIVVWTPNNGNTTNDIKVFAPATQKAEVEKFVAEVASHFDIAQAEALSAKEQY